MFIQTENTPNPNTLKFLPGKPVTGGQGIEFSSRKEAKNISPLVERLFDIDDVLSIFLGEDFVSITKSEEADWTAIKTLVLGVLFEHFSMNHPVLLTPVEPMARKSSAPLSEIEGRICELLDTRVRPAVAKDGGDIEFCEFDKGILWLRMRGACSGCPSSTITLKMGIENMMRHYIPEVLEVRAVQD
ncbi:MAG: NifU family protein [Alphaproteobacteria bacterium]|nr:NifU family protein [Alphaproteobacteria bacterium]